MRFKTKKIISFFLTASMLFSLSGVPALAEETEITKVIGSVEQPEEINTTESNEKITETEEMQLMSENISLMSSSSDIYYSEYGIYFNSSSGAITGADNTLSEYVIPESIDGITVTSIARYAFQNCKKMKSVILPDTIQSIGSYAFQNCTGLEEINITANRLEGVYSYAFSNCTALVSVTFSCNLLTGISDYAFQGCVSLATVDVSANPILTSIGREAFSGCRLLTNVKLPESLTAMGYRAFYNCTALQSIEIPPKADTYSSINNYGQWFYGCTALKSITIADGAAKIPDYAFQNCTSFTTITIPDTVTAVGAYAFSGCTQLTELPTMNGLITIGSGAFLGCKGLSSLSKLPDTVTVIGSSAFENCINLENITYLPSALEKIGSYGFSGCKYLEKVILPVGLLTINNNAFQNCTYLEYIFIPDSVTSIGSGILQSDSDAVIYGMDKSYAQTYATSNNIPFVTLTDIPNEKISITGVSLNKSTLSLIEGKSETLTVTVTPSNATDNSVSWKSSNTGVATVSNGVVTAVSAGTAVITVTTADGGYTAECTVTVTEKTVNANAPKITIANVKTMPGKEIQVTVDLANNTGFADLGIEVGYNSEVMTLTGITANSGVGATFTPAQSYTANPYNFGWSGTSNIVYNGNLATLTFTVAEDAPDGIYPITIDYYKGRNGDYTDGEDVNYDADYVPLNLKYVNGSITVKGATVNSSISVSGISFGVSLDGDTSTGTVYAAIYDSDGKLKNVKQYPAADTVNVAFDKGITGAYVKIMWWDDNMQPICGAQTIPLQ